MKRRVVITGMGTVNSLAQNVPGTWEKIKNGVSGITSLKKVKDPHLYSSQVAGQIIDLNYTKAFKNVKKAKKLDSFVHYAGWAMKEAADSCDLTSLIERNPYRVGICIGSGIGGIETHEREGEKVLTLGPKRISPFYLPALIANMASGYLAIEYNIQGPNFCVQTACATANHSIGLGLMMIQNNLADAMVTGGTEAGVSMFGVGSFCAMKALSTKFNDTPEKASRPFDIDRDGFVIAEGAGVLVLEEYEFAKNRGADIICELCSVGMTSDAYDMVMPHPDGEGGKRAMNIAIENAAVDITEVDHINSHGTSTPLGDIGETVAIRGLFSSHADSINVNSTKSMTGHLLGAAGGIESIITGLSLKNGIIPPTINLDNPDPKCDLNYTPNAAQERDIHVALSNSFGFGGQNASVCLRKM